jgi:predicted dehydrogenase
VLRVGIVGAGFMGTTHAASIVELDNAKLVGFYDLITEKSEKLSKRFGGKVFKTADELFKESDVVVLAIPPTERKEYYERLIELEKAIFAEKPVFRNLEDAIWLEEKLSKKTVPFMVGHVVRYFPEFFKLKEEYLKGTLGEISMIRSARVGSIPQWADWFRKFSLSGGVILDLAIHDIDFWAWMLGPVDSIRAVSNSFSENIETDHCIVVMKFKNGAVAHIEGGWSYPTAAPFKYSYEVVGTKNTISFDSLKNHTIVSYRDGIKLLHPTFINPYKMMMKDFLNAVEEERPVPIKPEDGIRSLKLALKAIESAKSGETISNVEG